MPDPAIGLAQVEAAEKELRAVIDRLASMIVNNDSYSSVKAGSVITNLKRTAGKAIAAVLPDSEFTGRRGSLVRVLDALGPPDDYETLEAIAIVADEEFDDDIRAHAREILDAVNWLTIRDLREAHSWRPAE